MKIAELEIDAKLKGPPPSYVQASSSRQQDRYVIGGAAKWQVVGDRYLRDAISGHV